MANAARALNDDARSAMRAIVPAILGNAFSSAASARSAEIEATIDRIDAAIRGLAPTAQKEVAELFLLLNAKPVRWAATGIADWQSASIDEVSAFLQRWRLHRLGLLQVAYHALHDLISGSHYSDASAWARTGFALPKAFQS